MKQVVIQWVKENILLLVLLLIVGFIGYKLFKPSPLVLDNSDVKVLEYKKELKEAAAKELVKSIKTIDSVYAEKYKNLSKLDKEQKQIDIRYEKDYKIIATANADEQFRILSEWLSKTDSSK